MRLGHYFLGISIVLATFNASRAVERIDYSRQIKPLLKQRCYACHGALKQKAGLRVDTVVALRKGGESGPAIEPGHAEESPLFERVNHTDGSLRMPPEGSPLTKEQVTLLRSWIEQGAVASADDPPDVDPKKHWAFQRILRPEVPSESGAGWVRNPIDAFLSAEQVKRGVAPLGPAEPHVLLRRVYLDLIGIPPTREELHAFLNDKSPVAYERVVDRLLSSTAYGERWARHWMDVWRYSDWYGRRAVPDVNNSYAQIWRWRDWIVRSLAEDKGYDRMLHEMLAADEIAPADDANLVATGFLVRNWYRWNYNTWMKDNVEHTAKAFLGLTIQCAHCHDHKYDPITQEDYFKFRALFEPLEIRHDRVPGEPDPGPYPKYEYGKAYGPISSGMVRVIDEKLDAQTFLYTRGESRNIVPRKPPIPPGVPTFIKGASFRIEPIDLPPEVAYPGLKPFIKREEIALRETAIAVAEKSLKLSRGALDAELQNLAKAESGGSLKDIVWAFTDGENRTRISAFGANKSVADATLQPVKSRVQLALKAVDVDEAVLAADRMELISLVARIAADSARFGKNKGDTTHLRRTAARAEREAQAAQAVVTLAKTKRETLLAVLKPKSGTAAKSDLAKAQAAQKAAETALIATNAKLGIESTEYTPISPTYPKGSTGRRTALAHWLTDRDNPLPARVAINHMWRWHFGVPFVESTHDFGRNGKAPSHPALLDWLAVELMEPSSPSTPPWSLKAIHRLILTSSAYRMKSHASDEANTRRKLDPENRLLWHFPPTRMEAEVIRDSLLHISGRLDLAVGGPDIDFMQGFSKNRRSIYFTHHGEAKMNFLELFDGVDACDGYKRSTSVVPQQALALMNNDFLINLSHSLSSKLWKDCTATNSIDANDQFLTAAFEQILTRSPTVQEREVSRAFLERQLKIIGKRPGADDPASKARQNLVQALFNHNDFVTIH